MYLFVCQTFHGVCVSHPTTNIPVGSVGSIGWDPLFFPRKHSLTSRNTSPSFFPSFVHASTRVCTFPIPCMYPPTSFEMVGSLGSIHTHPPDQTHPTSPQDAPSFLLPHSLLPPLRLSHGTRCTMFFFQMHREEGCPTLSVVWMDVSNSSLHSRGNATKHVLFPWNDGPTVVDETKECEVCI